MLNKVLLKTQKVSEKQEKKLLELHSELDEIFHTVYLMTDEVAEKLGYSLTIAIKDIEYQMQANWNFNQDANYHTWWYRMPKCSCPTMDNEERFGVSKIISHKCIIHKHLCDVN